MGPREIQIFCAHSMRRKSQHTAGSAITSSGSGTIWAGLMARAEGYSSIDTITNLIYAKDLLPILRGSSISTSEPLEQFKDTGNAI
jgi:hypothetical protein